MSLILLFQQVIYHCCSKSVTVLLYCNCERFFFIVVYLLVNYLAELKVYNNEYHYKTN